MFAKSKVLHPINAAAAHIVRVCPDGYGIEWAELSPPAVQLLTSMLEGTPGEIAAGESAEDREHANDARAPASPRRRQNARRR